jgi:hypothetical protein
MIATSPRARRRASPLIAFVVLCAAAGCGERFYPVRGKVVYEDGSPMPEGFVVAEMKDGDAVVMMRGEVHPDGTFQLGTLRPGDGARPGKYRVLITPRARTPGEEDLPPVLDTKFQSFETSGLSVEVQKAPNEFTFKVTKPKTRRR